MVPSNLSPCQHVKTSSFFFYNVADCKCKASLTLLQLVDSTGSLSQKLVIVDDE